MAKTSDDNSHDVDPTTLLAVMQALAHSGPESRRAAFKVSEEAIKIVLSPEDLSAVRDRMAAKDQVRRVELGLITAASVLDEGAGLVRGNEDQRLKDWEECVESVEDLWKLSAILWRDSRYGPATALAISTIEESGKLAVERFRLLGV